MKILLIILALISVLLSEEIKEQGIYQKLIISSSHTLSSLEAIQKYCNENTTIHALQKMHHFKIKMQTLGEYNVTVITPIESISLRNTLFIILSPIFKDVFYVEESLPKEENMSLAVKDDDTILWLYYGIGLVLLSLVGVFLSMKSRRKINELIDSQNDLVLEQQKMEKEITSLGGNSASNI